MDRDSNPSSSEAPCGAALVRAPSRFPQRRAIRPGRPQSSGGANPETKRRRAHRGARSPNDDAFPAPPALGAVRARSPSALVPRPEPAAAVAAAAAEELSGVRARGGVDAGCTLADTLQ